MVKMKTQTPAPGPEGIDFTAALPSQQDDDDLQVAMRTLRSGKLVKHFREPFNLTGPARLWAGPIRGN
jgi:hypothetical protein